MDKDSLYFSCDVEEVGSRWELRQLKVLIRFLTVGCMGADLLGLKDEENGTISRGYEFSGSCDLFLLGISNNDSTVKLPFLLRF